MNIPSSAKNNLRRRSLFVCRND